MGSKAPLEDDHQDPEATTADAKATAKAKDVAELKYVAAYFDQIAATAELTYADDKARIKADLSQVTASQPEERKSHNDELARAKRTRDYAFCQAAFYSTTGSG